MSVKEAVFWLLDFAGYRRIENPVKQPLVHQVSQKQAEERMEKLISQMAATEGVTEQLKEADQMLWVAKMNNIQSRAEEVVLSELVYSL